MSEAILKSRAKLLAEADLCVKCGLCLPHCPTYGVSRNEVEGPRGRISLAQGLASGQLLADASIAGHLDTCLSCRACERVCPAKVPYGSVLDGARAMLATPARTRMARLFGALFTAQLPRAVLRFGLWLLVRSGLARQAWAPKPLRGLPQHIRLGPAPISSAVSGVGLYTGCVSDVLERQVAVDAARLLRATGLELYVPEQQGCCGAIYQHAGLPARAQALAQANLQIFAACHTVLALTPGCGAALRDLLPQMKVVDLCQFLADRLAAYPLPFKTSDQRIGVHVACTQLNVMAAGSAVSSLLGLLPGVELLPLAAQSGCCGAAGTHFITHAKEANTLLQPKLDAAQQLAITVVASANIGCSLHMAAGLSVRGIKAEVVHPVSLLARALPEPP